MVNKSWQSHMAALTSCPDKLRGKMTIAKTSQSGRFSSLARSPGASAFGAASTLAVV
jgi:hypothetical protein